MGTALLIVGGLICAAALVVLLLSILLVGIYNNLVKLRERIKNAFAQIDVQLKRRWDLIPNLVETAKGYMKHERETLEAVIQARNQAASAGQRASGDPGDPQAIQALMGAEAMLSGTMGRLFALMENYPDLKANENMLNVQEELTTTENKVAFARQAYNDSVQSYMTARDIFPNNFVVGFFSGKFKPAESWVIEDESEKQAPQVSF